jgi:hypothetical protein
LHSAHCLISSSLPDSDGQQGSAPHTPGRVHSFPFSLQGVSSNRCRTVRRNLGRQGSRGRDHG